MKESICCEEKCTACMACANACPKGAIDIGINKYGYEKVVIDNGKCVDCGLCAKVCARRMQIERHSPIKCYAGQSRDSEKLKHSASGAAFQMLAEIVLEMGGVCYGCAGKMINGEYSAYHVRVTNVDELQSILNSKYILSHIGTTYQQIKEDLKNGKLVLFGGTPCQALGLKSFLNNEYENLIVVDTQMGKYFGTDGFRGEAGITLTADHAYKVGRFLGWYYNALRERNGDTDPARIVIGKDTRRSSYMFEYSLVAGLTASGADAYLLHVTTTPSVAYIARVDDFDCGIMISASHNPYYDNGIKLIDCYGEKMPEETLLLVEDYIDGKLHVFDKDWPELPFAHREHIGCTVDYVAGRNRYMGYLISLGIYSFKGVKVGLDCANGSSWNIAKSVFDALGADTYVINNKPNGLNINNNAGSTHIEGLQKFVVEKGLDVGFAYDGDADRCLCVDEKGNVITGDHILYIYGCYMKERGKLLTNTVVTTVMSNFGLYKAFDEQGIGYAKTAVGDKYVYEYMAKNGCRIGGEQSGHIIFSKYASTGDGILTSLKMMEVMLAKKKPMSELAAPLKIYPQVLENVRVTDKKAAQNDPAVQEAVSKVAEALGDTGRILVRESGTEPVVRVMVEAPDHNTCQKYVDEVVNVICEKGYKA